MDLLRSALNLPAEAIRCTSVEGHRLAGGDNTDATLKEEIRDADAFVGLISAASIESAYVLFELGARWGADRHLLPLLAPGADAGFLKGPLSGINALSSGSTADLHQMVKELGELLDLKPEAPAVYQRRLDEIMSAVARIRSSAIQEVKPGSPTAARETVAREVASDTGSNYAGAEAIIQRHCDEEWPDDYRMKAYCIDQQRSALAELERGRPADIAEEIFARIRSKCEGEWPEDYRMRQYCEEEQIKAYRKLGGG